MSEDVDFFEEIYELCQEVITPHIMCQAYGGCCITQESLIPSVVESLEYLVEFWVKNRDNPTVDLCLD